MTKGRTTIYALLVSCVVALPAYGAELRIGLQEDPDLLDPHQSRTFVGRIVYASLCDTLLEISPKLEIIPELATDWKWSDDATELVMNLRQGVVFHDGTPFNAAAVVANIERALTLPESNRKSDLSSVDNVKATGDYQVTLKLKKPDVSLLSQLTDRGGMMLSPTAFAKSGTDFGSQPVCSGPFRFVERVQQDRIVLEKFPEYYNASEIKIDRVVYLPIPDSTVRLANLQSGDIDMLERLAPSDVAAVQSDPKLAYAEVVGLGNQAFYVNIANGAGADNPLGKDKRLRQAFSMAIDRETINQVVFEGRQSPGNQWIAPSSPWYNAKFPVQKADPVAARALLKDAGFDRVEVEVQVGNNTVQMQLMQVIQSMVAEAGFDLKLRPTEMASMMQSADSGTFQLHRSDQSGRLDPDGVIRQKLTCKGGTNDGHYCNAEFDRLLDEARTIVDPAQRKVRIDAAIAILMDEVPAIFIGHQSYIWGMNASLKGFAPSPDGLIRLNGVTIDK